MRISEKQLRAAVLAYHGDDFFDCFEEGSEFANEKVEAIRAAIEAALSAAEPVAWQPRYKQEVIDHHKSIGSDLCEYAMTVYPTKEQAQGYGYGGHECRALYAEPQPAPSVAVKAQQAVWIKHDGKNMPVNAETIVEVRMASGFEHEADLAGNWLEREGSKSNWHHDLGCPHPCDIVAYHIVPNSPALSAQVQDVAGWQIVPIEPTEEMEKAGRKEAADCDDTYGSSIFSAAEIYRAMLAAAPAKQEVGTNE
jgi:hypothetical protein